MRRLAARFLAVALLISTIPLAGCEDPVNSGSGGGASTYLGGVWDIILTPSGGGQALSYQVTVEQPGGSGVARISVSGPLASDSATVTADAALPLGSCGLTISFGNTAGFNLALGDQWTVAVNNDTPGPPAPSASNTSLTGPVASGGTYTCASTLCDGSALASAPSMGGAVPGAAGSGGQWRSVRLAQSGANVTGTVAEQHILSLGLISPPFPPMIAIGDTVTLTYRRSMAADGLDGDFLRVIVTNGPEMPDAEYLFGSSVLAAETTVSLSFTARSSTVLADFIAGLSDPGESVTIDDVTISTASGGIVFAENFEAVGGCEPPQPWAVLSPAWEVGDFCVSAAGAISGARSARWTGGSKRQLSGSIIEQSSSSDLAGLLGGGFGGISGGAGASFSGLSLQAWEADWTNYLTVFSATEAQPGTMAGTFRGEARGSDCVEDGQMTATLHATEAADLASKYWVVRIDGEAINCDPALGFGNTLYFGDTLTAAPGDTITMAQFGQIVVALQNPVDDHGNAYRLNGVVTNNLVTITLRDSGGLVTASGLGAISGDLIQGALTGSLLFGGGRKCELSENGAFAVLLVAP